MPHWTALDISKKNIFNNFALKRRVVFAPLLIPQDFLHPSKKLPTAIVISSNMEQKQSMYRLKSLREKTLSLAVNG